MSTSASALHTALPAAPTKREPTNYLNASHGLKSWLLTVDHKRIAILYLLGVTFFFAVGGLLAFILRLELLTPSADLMAMDTYNKTITMHGIVMVFFVLIPAVPAVLGNFLIPLMIGARDLAFPRINLLSWYCFLVAGMLLLYTVIMGGVDTGWTFTTPLSTRFVNTNVISAGLAAFVSASHRSSPA
jgi:cytochrome c oxidase subunit 1